MRHSFMWLIPAVLAIVAGCQSTAPAGDVHASANGSRTASSPANQESSESAPPNTAVMYVHGMGCPQCAHNVDLQLLKVPGVEDVTIDMGSGRVTARLSPSQPPTRDQLARAIDETGFTLVKIAMPQ